MNRNILITGGAGFIGSHLVRFMTKKYPNYNIVNFDKLTYAGNLENLSDVENFSNYYFERGDITRPENLTAVFEKYNITDVIHLAAESHVDRSIDSPMEFVSTNVIGTVHLLNLAKKYWIDKEPRLSESDYNIFYHVSTDEVYGSLGPQGFFTESSAYDPRSPYSASKASSDHFVRAYAETYGLKTKISNCSNNYGPNHFPEKLIPLFIHNIINNIHLPLYGDGQYTRDWLYVEDHVSAIDLIFHKGKINQSYNVGGFNEWTNLDLVNLLCDKMDIQLGRKLGSSRDLITFVTDRSGHDRRYAIDASKLNKELGWMPSVTFEEGLTKTILWYLSNEKWLENITAGSYKDYYNKMYNSRL